MKLWIVLALISANACASKVKVDVYYESLCPDSVRFIDQQLKPSYQDLKNHLDITFVPFGKSSSYQVTPGSPIEFDCQHGPDECFGNKVQGCMLSRIPDQDTQVNYVSCQMRSNADRSHQACVEAFGVQWAEILQCVESEFATKQQLDYEQATSPVLQQTNWVPTVIYEGKITSDSHTGNGRALHEVICEMINNINPACKARSF